MERKVELYMVNNVVIIGKTVGENVIEDPRMIAIQTGTDASLGLIIQFRPLPFEPKVIREVKAIYKADCPAEIEKMYTRETSGLVVQ